MSGLLWAETITVWRKGPEVDYHATWRREIITDVRPATRPDLGPGPAAGGWARLAGPRAELLKRLEEFTMEGK